MKSLDIKSEYARLNVIDIARNLEEAKVSEDNISHI